MTSTPSTELLASLGISQAGYYRLKKAGKLQSRLSSSRTETHVKYVTEWIQWRSSGLHSKPWSDITKANQVYQLKRFLCRFPTVSARHLEEWIAELSPLQQSSRQDRHTSVSSFARYLHHAGKLEADEYNAIVKLYPKQSPYYQPKQRIIYADDLVLLLGKAAKGHNRYQAALNTALLTFLSETGLRVSEACNLTQGHLHFSPEPKQARVSVINGKGGKNRVVPFSKAAQLAVKSYLAVRPKSLPSPLFYAFNPKYDYTPITRDVVARRFKKIADDTGVDFSAHSLRHYRITQWANNPRIPITVVQKWAGHSSLEVTQRYIHIQDDEAFAAAFE